MRKGWTIQVVFEGSEMISMLGDQSMNING